MDVKDACRRKSNVFRRGDPQELLQHGSSIAVIRSSGAWLGSGFGSYVDVEFDKERKISKIATAQISGDSSSEGDSEIPTRKRGKNLRKRGREGPLGDLKVFHHRPI